MSRARNRARRRADCLCTYCHWRAMERLRKHDVILNRELQNNIQQLNHEIEQRKHAQLERETTLSELEQQIKEKSDQERQASRLSRLTRSIIDASPDLIYYRNEEGKFAGRLGLLAFGRDMTERKRTQVAFEQASKDKTKFIATISHELRTPLNGIVGLSRMLRDTQLEKEQFEWVSTIYASAITLGNIFNDIIDLDKLDRDKIEIQLKTVSTAAFVNEIASIIRLLAKDKNLSFKHKIVEPVPASFKADGTRLRQVLWNMLFNAIKFTTKGYVSLTMSATLKSELEADIHFTIQDTGVGIPKEELDKIFAMYYQVQRDGFQAATGTGIGLAICQQMVDKMGGKIEVNSEVDRGTCFEITLPVTVSEDRVVSEELRVRGLNILLVEDIELNVLVAKVFNELFADSINEPLTIQNPPVKDTKVKINKNTDNVLDVDLLGMLIETIGDSMVKTSLGVFKDKIPEYVEEIKVALAAQDKDEVCSQAHKIKGAASSVGLSRVQASANQIQQGDHPAWWENVHDWMEHLEMALEQDVPTLEQWIIDNEIDD